MQVKKIVLALDLHDDKKCKKKVINLASSVTGIDSISLDIEKKQLTLIGTMDPLQVVKKLRKTYRADLVTVGPAKEPEKEKPKTEDVTPIVYPYVYNNPYYPRFYYEYIY